MALEESQKMEEEYKEEEKENIPEYKAMEVYENEILKESKDKIEDLKEIENEV